MAYKVSLELNDGIVQAVVTGQRDPNNTVSDGSRSWSEIIEFVKSANATKLLIISKLQGELNLVKSVNIVNNFKKLGLPENLKVAFLETNQEAWSSNSFAASKAYQNGYYIKIFNEKDEAVSWLKKSF